ncbi:hypothetical protein ACO0QE_000959 [Hanseniaspora vineae]
MGGTSGRLPDNGEATYNNITPHTGFFNDTDSFAPHNSEDLRTRQTYNVGYGQYTLKEQIEKDKMGVPGSYQQPQQQQPYISNGQQANEYNTQKAFPTEQQQQRQRYQQQQYQQQQLQQQHHQQQQQYQQYPQQHPQQHPPQAQPTKTPQHSSANMNVPRTNRVTKNTVPQQSPVYRTMAQHNSTKLSPQLQQQIQQQMKQQQQQIQQRQQLHIQQQQQQQQQIQQKQKHQQQQQQQQQYLNSSNATAKNAPGMNMANQQESTNETPKPAPYNSQLQDTNSKQAHGKQEPAQSLQNIPSHMLGLLNPENAAKATIVHPESLTNQPPLPYPVRKYFANMAILRVHEIINMLLMVRMGPNGKDPQGLTNFVNETFAPYCNIKYTVRNQAKEIRTYDLSVLVFADFLKNWLSSCTVRVEIVPQQLRSQVLNNGTIMFECPCCTFTRYFDDGSYITRFFQMKGIFDSWLKLEWLDLNGHSFITGVEWGSIERLLLNPQETKDIFYSMISKEGTTEEESAIGEFSVEKKTENTKEDLQKEAKSTLENDGQIPPGESGTSLDASIEKLRSKFEIFQNLNSFGTTESFMKILQVNDVMQHLKSLMLYQRLNNVNSPLESMYQLVNNMKLQQKQAAEANKKAAPAFSPPSAEIQPQAFSQASPTPSVFQQRPPNTFAGATPQNSPPPGYAANRYSASSAQAVPQNFQPQGSPQEKYFSGQNTPQEPLKNYPNNPPYTSTTTGPAVRQYAGSSEQLNNSYMHSVHPTSTTGHAPSGSYGESLHPSQTQPGQNQYYEQPSQQHSGMSSTSNLNDHSFGPGSGSAEPSVMPVPQNRSPSGLSPHSQVQIDYNADTFKQNKPEKY